MLSLSPVSDPIRDALNVQVRHFSILGGWATLVVAIGVALEGVELVHDIIAWWKRKRRDKRERSDLSEVAYIFPTGEIRAGTELHFDHPRWVKRFSRIGLIMVVVGVVAEWRCGAKLEDAHNAVHEYDIALLGDAAKSAKGAHDLGIDLLGKYTAAEQEIIELKAAKLPRRLSSDQKDIFRRAVTSFKGRTFDISCATPGGDAKEPLDFELDFVDAINRKTPVQFQYLTSCNTMVGGGVFFIPPIQVEAGADRTGDEELLTKALAAIGISKKQITKKLNENKELLSLTIGPKPL
jgi:hypothetical protein